MNLYCDALAVEKVMCTIKHFPGLGRVSRDTHVMRATLDATAADLHSKDWIPFRTLMKRPHIATMMAHVRVPSIDKDHAASFSKPVISGLMRGDWKHDGLIVTDDFSMGAVTRSPDGVGNAAVKALNAGADFVLVSFNERHYDAVMGTLLKAESDRVFDTKKRSESVKRIERFLAQAR
jgi:beta-N-acetylhexosaminidase